MAIFGPFPQFLGAKNAFPQNRVVMHNLIRVSGTMPKLEKFNDPIPRKHPYRCGDARIDNPISRILSATAMGLTSKMAVNWHLKVKDIEYDVVLTKND